MRANYKMAAALRCPWCKGWGHVEPPPSHNHGLPVGPEDYLPCKPCQGSGQRGGLTLAQRVSRIEAHLGLGVRP